MGGEVNTVMYSFMYKPIKALLAVVAAVCFIFVAFAIPPAQAQELLPSASNPAIPAEF